MNKTSVFFPRRVLLPVGLGTALSLIGDATMYTVMPTHMAEAGIVLSNVGILLSANRFIRLGANGAIGWLCDHWSRRYIFILALFTGALSTAICAFTQGFIPLLAGRLLWGMAWAGIWVAGNGIILDVAGVSTRGRWVGYYHVSFFLGSAIGSLLGGLLTDWLGYHQSLAVATVLALIGAVVAWLLLPEMKERPALAAGGGAVETVPTPPLGVTRPASAVGELTSAAALLGINRVVIAGILAPTMGLYLLQVFGDPIRLAGWTVGLATLTGAALGLSTLLSMLLTPVTGGLSDWLNSRWRVIAGGLIFGVMGFALLALGTPEAMLIGVPFTAVVSSSSQGLSTALMGDLTDVRQRGRFLGILYTIGDLGSAIGPPLAYALIPVWGIQALYWLCAGLLAFMLMVALRWSLELSATRG